LTKAIGLLEALVAEHPDRPDYQRLLAMSYLESTKDREIARSEEGQHLRSEAIELLTGLVERFPNNPDYRFALSAAYAWGRPDTRRLGDSKIDAYLKRLLFAEGLLAELRRDHPSVPQYLAAQMQLFRHICMIHKGTGNNDDALKTYRRAVKIFQDSSADALTPETVMAASEVYYRMVELLQRESRRDPEKRDELLKEARSHLETNAKLFEQTANPSVDFGRLMRLTGIYKQFAEEFRDLGDDASAESVMEILKQATEWAGPNRER
jgi:tetratricopeptide (TPR) repeat protein